MVSHWRFLLGRMGYHWTYHIKLSTWHIWKYKFSVRTADRGMTGVTDHTGTAQLIKTNEHTWPAPVVFLDSTIVFKNFLVKFFSFWYFTWESESWCSSGCEKCRVASVVQLETNQIVWRTIVWGNEVTTRSSLHVYIL